MTDQQEFQRFSSKINASDCVVDTGKKDWLVDYSYRSHLVTNIEGGGVFLASIVPDFYSAVVASGSYWIS